ncbi:MAG: hypothetical protein PVF96_07200 [Candidatus Bathyarchaeota archaeon]
MKEEDSEKTIRVKMKIGEVEFEVECQEEQLQTTIDKILSTVTKRLKEAQLVIERTKPSRNYAETCKGVIMRLWEEKFFLEPRKLGQIHDEMARRGFHYDRTAVAHALVDLVKDGILTREGKPRRYVYAQRRPPTSTNNI